MSRSWFLFVLPCLAALATPGASGGIVQLACKGAFERSHTEPRARCHESDVLADPDGGWINGFTEATADLDAGSIGAGAAGGAVRGVGYTGRESSAILVEQLAVDGEWQGAMPVTIIMRLRYGFEGEGKSLLFAALGASSRNVGRTRQRAELHLEHADLAGASIRIGKTVGRVLVPEAGDYAARATLEVHLVQPVDADIGELEVRADLNVYALPNLRDFDESIAALVHADVEIELATPCPATIVSIAHAARWPQHVRPMDGEGWRCGDTEAQ